MGWKRSKSIDGSRPIADIVARGENGLKPDAGAKLRERPTTYDEHAHCFRLLGFRLDDLGPRANQFVGTRSDNVKRNEVGVFPRRGLSR